jgi:hypothetical protein
LVFICHARMFCQRHRDCVKSNICSLIITIIEIELHREKWLMCITHSASAESGFWYLQYSKLV